jgi:hypothetical protein
MDRVWQLFDAPPTDMGMILHPEEYAPSRRIAHDFNQVFQGATHDQLIQGASVALKTSNAGYINIQLGPASMDFKFSFECLPELDRTELANALVTCQDFRAVDDGSRAFLNLTLYELKDPENAQRLVDLLTEVFGSPKIVGDRLSRIRAEIARLTADQISNEKVLKRMKAGEMPDYSSLFGAFPSPLSTDRFLVKAQGPYVVSFWGRSDRVEPDKIEAYLSDVLRKVSELGPVGEPVRAPSTKGTSAIGRP